MIFSFFQSFNEYYFDENTHHENNKTNIQLFMEIFFFT